MPRFLQALSKQQHQKSIVILHENTKIRRCQTMIPGKENVGSVLWKHWGWEKHASAKKNKQKHRKKCHDDKTGRYPGKGSKKGFREHKGFNSGTQTAIPSIHAFGYSVTIQEKARRCQDSDEKEEEFKSRQKTQAHIVEKQEEKATQ